jgi:hypothetical protein
MALIKVKPQIGEVASVHYPAFLDEYHNPIVLIFTGKITDVNSSREILIRDAPFHVPEWRIEWFTFGNIPINNPKFNILKINNENKRIIQKEIKKLQKK